MDLGDGRSIVAVLYDGLLSAAVSFEPAATVDADWFVRDRLLPRLAQEPLPGEAPPLVVIATDGELYGHHQPLRDHFLSRLVGRTAPRDPPYATPTLAAAVERAAATGLPLGRLRDRTSWSCHHGIARWGASCECVPDGAWKGPLRSALDRLAGGVDAATEQLLRGLPGQPDAWAARDASVDLLLGLETVGTFADRWLAPAASPTDRATFAAVMEAQRWRLAMFASCGWFWDEPARIETAGALRAAMRAARLIDGLAGTDLERRLVADLALVSADGVAVLDAALRPWVRSAGAVPSETVRRRILVPSPSDDRTRSSHDGSSSPISAVARSRSPWSGSLGARRQDPGRLERPAAVRAAVHRRHPPASGPHRPPPPRRRPPRRARTGDGITWERVNLGFVRHTSSREPARRPSSIPARPGSEGDIAAGARTDRPGLGCRRPRDRHALSRRSRRAVSPRS